MSEEKRKSREMLEQTLLTALKEGEPVEATPEWWAALRSEVGGRSKARRTAKES